MTPTVRRRDGEEGYLLLWLVVVCFLLLLALGVAAPRVAKELERDREVESEHRAQEYVRAIQLYYRKNVAYPTSLDQLLGTGTTGTLSALNVKYLRQQYKDPLTRDDYRLIHLGEAKTEVKGFFGDPLPGVAAGNLGSVAGSQSNMTGGSSFGSTGSAFGGSAAPAGAATTGAATLIGNAVATSTAAGAAPVTAAGTPPSTDASGSAAAGASTASAGATPFGGTGTSAASFQGSKGGIVGVGSNAKGPGLVEWNGSANIEEWEFLYDPRVEALKAKVSLFGGAPAATGSGSIGSGFAPAAGINAPAGAPGTFGAPATGTAGSATPATGTAPSANPQ